MKHSWKKCSSSQHLTHGYFVYELKLIVIMMKNVYVLLLQMLNR
ncbi:unnamed protein product [Schistosoma curassoni]|uniref:Uncharacterized protein n=1 Tax=Schistosoma curassoni TaxID=6186 RepID=A0A183L197_9TREM|nr:unnamed protein product [Schistosoma curassoni]